MSMIKPVFLSPAWNAPPQIFAASSTRVGGVSVAPFDSFNLGLHVGDDPVAVAQNRARLCEHVPGVPVWLNQVHGTHVVDAATVGAVPMDADAAVSRTPGVLCAVMTADCLPLLFCDRAGTVVAAAHAGWKGLCAGVIEATVAAMNVDTSELLVWMGPAISPDAFEVGSEVCAAFMAHDHLALQHFQALPDGKWLADIYGLAQQRLMALGIPARAVSGGEYCTVIEREHFFSYRREQKTGRMASMIGLCGLP